nr:serine/threonine-protein kinase Nek4-like isoform X2 [Lytechinus pictus]
MSLDMYEHLKAVGKGSYGEVWLVKHKKDKKQFVIKKMELLRASKREKKAAEQEAKLLSKLRHPNIVSYKDSFESEEGFLYIVMGFCDGGDLYTRLKQQKTVALEERQVVEWFVQIAMALQYMHERNILHRDLKTQNIFLTKSKIIKVGDLGIARVLEGNNDMATTLIGTPYYMSPELFSNRPYNHKSDVWALGCCVYEMTTLKHAFNAKDMNSLVYKILRGKMPAMPHQYSTELVELIKATLNQSPEKRPSVSRLLRNPYIKKHIAIFLEGTRARRPSTSSESSRRGSKADIQEIEEQSTPDSETGGKDLPAISEVPSKKVKDNQSKSSNPRPGSAGKERKSAQGVRKSQPSASKEGKSRSNVKTPSEPKLPPKKSRPLPVPPKGGTPETSKGAKRSTNSASSSRTSSTSSVSNSRDDASTPRTDRGSSARARRREKLRESQEHQSPLSQVRRSSDAVHRSHDETDSNHPRRPVSHTKSDPVSKESPSSSSTSHSRDERTNRHTRAESRDTDSTISDEEEEEDDSKSSRKKKGDGDEMEEFSNLLATTLRIEKKKKVVGEGGDFGRDSPDTPEEPSPPPSARPGSGSNLNGTQDIAIEAAAPRAPKGLGNATMTTSGRLMDRIAMLRKDIMQGIGIELLTQAYEILEKDDDEDTEMDKEYRETQLMQLMGKQKFDIYGGKIWQLKFCEETVFG